MRALPALLFLAGVSLGNGAHACAAPGEPVQWRADFCMLKMETDDEIAVSACIEAEGKRRFPGACSANTYFKKRMCRMMLRNGTLRGTLAACVRDPAFMGRTVRNGGVGG
jgi:hypothetical protein